MIKQPLKLNYLFSTLFLNPTTDNRTKQCAIARDSETHVFNGSVLNVPSEVKPLAHLAEFKLLMSLLQYSQHINAPCVQFRSINELLKTVGYTPSGFGINAFYTMINTFKFTTCVFKTESFFSKFDVLTNWETECTPVGVQFNQSFWELCQGAYALETEKDILNKFFTVDLTVLKQLKSPKQLQIYLYLCKHLNFKNFFKSKKFLIEDFINETNLHFNSNKVYSLSFDIRKTLTTINHQLPTRLMLNEILFKDSRQIQFLRSYC